jgi:putative effector of murein hydrolase LrgA (UPF0299 family)
MIVDQFLITLGLSVIGFLIITAGIITDVVTWKRVERRKGELIK